MILSIIVPRLLIFLLPILPLIIAKDQVAETTNIADTANIAKHAQGNIAEKLARAADASLATITLTPSAQWTFFDFGNLGTNVTTSYFVNQTAASSLLITDLLYQGDSFALYMNNSYVGSSCLRPPLMMAIPEGNPNATYGLAVPVQSYHCWAVAPGPVTIVIGVNQSPFTAGTAAISLSASNVCPVNPAC